MNKIMQKLSVLRSEEVIRDIDLEICRFLRNQHPDIPGPVLLAACLVSYNYRQGNVCVELNRYAGQSLFVDGDTETEITAPDLGRWSQLLAGSPAIGSPGEFCPLILDGQNRLYLHKLWHYEDLLAQELIKRSSARAEDINQDILQDGLQRLFAHSTQQPDWQQVAAVSALHHKLAIISGGPGTGKTSTVVRILALLLEQQQGEGSPNIALAAPTGKAAARLKDAIAAAKDDLNVSEEIRAAVPDDAVTIHQLLGARRHTAAFKHNSDNPLPYDTIIVDEASMVDQALMSKLMEALLADCRLILLGDKDQLASVEAGSVLGDICNIEQNGFSSAFAQELSQLDLQIPERNQQQAPYPLTDNITLLTKSYRFDSDSGIGRLADSVNRGEAEQATQVLDDPSYNDTSLVTIPDHSTLEQVIGDEMRTYFKNIVNSSSPQEALTAFNRMRILAAHRRGPWGVRYLNQLVERILQQEHLIPKYRQWYPGKPVIINVNDYSLRLHNGDTGLCLPDEEGELKIYFRHEDTVRAIAPGRLPDHSTAYVLTVHKSQGSEFDKLMLVLPDSDSKVLSRELIYTAITRSRTAISILGDQSVLRAGIEKRLQRASGLQDRLWEK
ncbi:exodeoxyribonuclease V subunit alpha [Fodinibius halophilus]|uniref:Exodeoxyribonuclease V subunit alpha n=1 Tax=Fodinibius halophilus TaxID=1736908 RepID=A0A6M1T5T9_9BACT|nr:exodeoxyribonuclease V subunit alpha [Fodinibius halophilus]NGP88013.1 exodeoxyribonuclease V subunit alpha [Fodinibius halophilus]